MKFSTAFNLFTANNRIWGLSIIPYLIMYPRTITNRIKWFGLFRYIQLAVKESSWLVDGGLDCSYVTVFNGTPTFDPCYSFDTELVPKVICKDGTYPVESFMKFDRSLSTFVSPVLFNPPHKAYID